LRVLLRTLRWGLVALLRRGPFRLTLLALALALTLTLATLAGGRSALSLAFAATLGARPTRGVGVGLGVGGISAACAAGLTPHLGAALTLRLAALTLTLRACAGLVPPCAFCSGKTRACDKSDGRDRR
jgi:hypothetical protein